MGSRLHLSARQELANLGNSQQTLERGITILVTGATEKWEFCERACAAGLQLDRVSVFVDTFTRPMQGEFGARVRSTAGW